MTKALQWKCESISYSKYVSQAMHTEVVSLHGNSDAKQAAKLITKHKIGCVVIRDENGVPIGIVTEKDLVSKVIAESEKGMTPDTQLRYLMSSPLITIGAYSTLGSAAKVMTSQDIKRLPVVDDTGKLVGIITLSDILRETMVDPSLSQEAAMEYIHEVLSFVYSQAKTP